MKPAVSEFPFLVDADDRRPALMDDTSIAWLSYGDLKILARQWRDQLAGPKGLVFLFVHNDIDSVAALLGGHAAGHAVALFDPAMSTELRSRLVRLYSPDWIVDAQAAPQIERTVGCSSSLHAGVAVLLSTSGSTGSPKLVRLTTDNLSRNAHAIGEALNIGEDDVACGHLPLHYSFGLSVITSHLLRGARIRITALGFMDRAFWPAMREAEISHLPGVPFHFNILQKLGYRRLNIPSLKSLAQAGGFLNVEARREAHTFMESSGGRFYVMYGQTEAAPRMTTLTHEAFSQAPGSVGTPLPGCHVSIKDADAQGHGEVVFDGPNVMMGYAECRDDLTRGDDLCGQLVTGDIGYLDDGGRLTLTGRSKRFGKIYGLRVNLDEIEAFANEITEVAVTQIDDSLIVHMIELESPTNTNEKWQMLLESLKRRYTLPAASYQVEYIVSMPFTERGKIDYAKLRTD